MSKTVTKVFAIALTLALGLVCLAGCGGGSTDSSSTSGTSTTAPASSNDIVGKWTVDKVSMGGTEVSAEQMGGQYDFTFDFTADGKVNISAQGETSSGAYSVGSDGVISFDGQAASTDGFSMTFKDGVMKMDLGNGAATITFKKA